MGRQILRWYVFNVFMGLIPISISATVQIFNTNYKGEYLIEILFLSLMVCASSLDDIAELRSQFSIKKHSTILDLLHYVFLILTILMAGIYTMKFSETITGVIIFDKVDRFFQFFISSCVLCVVLGTVAQVIINQIEIDIKNSLQT